MYTTNLRKVGGSVMLAVPRAVLELLDLEPGSTIALAVKGEQLVIERPKIHYKLDDLLDQCSPRNRKTKQDREWIDLPAVGREL